MALSDNLVAYWNFDDGSGTTVNDAVGTKDLTTNSDWATDGTLGAVGDFESGNSDYSYKAAGDLYPLITDSFTVQAWVKSESLPGGAQAFVVSKGGNTGVNYGRYHLAYDNGTSKWAYLAHTTAGAQHDIYSDNTVTNGNRYHLVITNAAGAMKMYVNGTLQADTDTIASYRNDSETEFRIGRAAAGTGYWDGFITCVGYWSRALSGTEVTELYNSGTPLRYPFATNVTVTPQALNLSTGAATQSIYLTMPVLSMGGTLQTLVPTIQGASSGGQNNDYTAGTVRNGTGGPGTQYIYADRPTATAKIDDSKYDYSKVKDPRSY